MKYVSSLKPRCKDCQIVIRKGVRTRICKKDPKHKAKQG